MDINPPHPTDNYTPRYLGIRPAYGWFIRNSYGIIMENVTVSYEKEDQRPAIIFDNVNLTVLDNFSAESSASE